MGLKPEKTYPFTLTNPRPQPGFPATHIILQNCGHVAIVQYFSKITQVIINPFEQSTTPQKINLRKVSLACIVREQKTPKFMK